MKKVLSILVALLMLAGSAALADLNLLQSDLYPMETEISLSWYIGTGYQVNDAYASWEDSPFHMGLMDMTGVNIEWITVTAGTDLNQAFNLMLAGDTLPDIIFSDLIMRDAERYMEEGVIRDLTEYMEEYSPAYYQFLQSDPAYDKAMKTDEGKYYGYGFFREAGGWNDSYQGPVIRMDWLEEQGLEIPVTISDWENVLTVFKDAYGATFTAPWSRFRQGGISGAWDAYGMNDIQFFLRDGEVHLAQAEVEWFEYLTTLNDWWNKGLIDQDILTQDDTATKAKALAGSTGLAYTSMGQMTNWRSEAEQAGTGADWQGIRYPEGDDGTLSMIFGGYGIGNVVAAISGDCPDEKLETAMRLLDYAYTDEGNLYWNYGKQGVSWDYDEDGNPAYLPLVTEDPDGINDAISKYGGSTWSGNCIQATLLLYLKNSPESIAANDTWFYTHEDVTSYWKLPPGITLTADESSEYDFAIGSITTLVAETAAKLVTGEMGMDDYDSYLEQLNGMGLQTVIDIQQAGYDRYQAR